MHQLTKSVAVLAGSSNASASVWRTMFCVGPMNLRKVSLDHGHDRIQRQWQRREIYFHKAEEAYIAQMEQSEGIASSSEGNASRMTVTLGAVSSWWLRRAYAHDALSTR